jgi:hypothetical protein
VRLERVLNTPDGSTFPLKEQKANDLMKEEILF